MLFSPKTERMSEISINCTLFGHNTVSRETPAPAGSKNRMLIYVVPREIICNSITSTVRGVVLYDIYNNVKNQCFARAIMRFALRVISSYVLSAMASRARIAEPTPNPYAPA